MISATFTLIKKNSKATKLIHEIYHKNHDFLEDLEDEKNKIGVQTTIPFVLRMFADESFEKDESVKVDLEEFCELLRKDYLTIAKQVITYSLFKNEVITNGYDIRCFDSVSDILRRYDLYVYLNHALFILNGVGCSGKDTFFLKVQKYHDSVFSFSTIDPIRNMLMENGIDTSQKTEKDRKLLSDIKNAIMTYDENYSINNVRKIDDKIYNEHNLEDSHNSSFLFVHCREKEDIERIKKLGAYTILIKNDNIPAIESNDSDKNVLNQDYDFIIDNSGTLEDLDRKAKIFTETILNTGFNINHEV